MHTKNIEKYCCRITTYSTVALSPRGQAGYYEGIHFNQADINKEGEEKSVSSIRSTSMDAIRSIAPSIHSIIYQALP